MRDWREQVEECVRKLYGVPAEDSADVKRRSARHRQLDDAQRAKTDRVLKSIVRGINNETTRQIDETSHYRGES